MVHEPEVKSMQTLGVKKFWAQCVCGWRGKASTDQREAGDDAYEHRIAHGE